MYVISNYPLIRCVVVYDSDDTDRLKHFVTVTFKAVKGHGEK